MLFHVKAILPWCVIEDFYKVFPFLLRMISFDKGICLIFSSALGPNIVFTFALQAGTITFSASV